MIFLVELKQLPIWVNYFYDGNDRFPPKAPIDPNNYRGASVTNPDTWGDYASASCHIENDGAGVGIVFCELPDGLYLAGIDIDAHNTAHNPLTEEILERFRDTYAECSPSGNGIHILFEVDIKAVLAAMGGKWDNDMYFWKNSELEIECYVGGLTNRYFTFTEEAVNDNPIVDMTQPFLQFLDDYMRRPTAQNVQTEKPSQVPFSSKQLSIEDILTKARNAANGDKFSALFDRGDISGYNYDDSRADMALCKMLAWWSGGDYNTIDKLFRQSALYRDTRERPDNHERRDKWEREKYRIPTIRKAIAYHNGNFYSPGGTYPPTTTNCPAPSSTTIEEKPFILYDKYGYPKEVIPTQLAKDYRNNEHYKFLNTGGEHPLCMHYDSENGIYHIKEKTRLQGTIKKRIEEVDENLVTMRVLDETYRLLTTDLERVSADDFNTNQDIIIFKNGVLKLSTMELLPHSPTYLSTIQIPCNYTPDAGECLIFDAFIDQLSNNDESVANLLWEYLGLSISNIFGFRAKKALCLLGKGNTGKSRFVEFVRLLVGVENYASVTLQGLEKRFGTHGIYGKRVIGCADLPSTSVSELNIFKQLTGGDPISFEGKYKDAFTARYNGTLVFAANELPEFGGDHGDHVFERLMIVPCVNSISEEQWDNELVDKFWEEREAIVTKAVIHLQEFVARGCKFDEPEICRKVRAQYKLDTEPTLAFLQECTVPREQADHDQITTRDQMYTAYCRFCSTGNLKEKNRQQFRKFLFQNGVCDKHNSNKRFYSVELTSEAREHLLYDL